jgi:hypothetical protein
MREAVAPKHDVVSRLADAQEQIRRLELLALRQEKRIKEIEGALHGEPSPEPAPEPPAKRWSDLRDESPRNCNCSVSDLDATTTEIPSTPEAPSRHLRCEATPVDPPYSSWQSYPPIQQGASSGLQLAGSQLETCHWPCSLEQWFDHSQSPELESFVTSRECADASNPMCQVTSHSTELMWYVVTFISGIDIRAVPDADGPRTGIILPQHSVFSVSEVVPGVDGRAYLRLSDGRGWVFDDLSYFPDDPSVRRLPPAQRVPPPPPPPPFAVPMMPPPPDHSPSIPLEGQPVILQMRGKRGGAKRRKRGGVKHRPRSEA